MGWIGSHNMCNSALMSRCSLLIPSMHLLGLFMDSWISEVVHDRRDERRDHRSEIKQTFKKKNCAFFVARRDKYASVMSRPPFWCSRLKCVFVQFHWDDKRPPAAHKLLLLKGVARIQTSVKTKSSLDCCAAAEELGCYVQLLVHVLKLHSLNLHVC